MTIDECTHFYEVPHIHITKHVLGTLCIFLLQKNWMMVYIESMFLTHAVCNIWLKLFWTNLTLTLKGYLMAKRYLY